MFALSVAVSDSASSRWCWPMTLRNVVCAIWSIADFTLSIAITDFTASTTR
jgi:hypothetical protein